jgi:hypothetical protein
MSNSELGDPTGRTRHRQSPVAPEGPTGDSWWPIKIAKITVVIAGQHKFGKIIAILVATTAALNLLVLLAGLLSFSNSLTFVAKYSTSQAPKNAPKSTEAFIVTSNKLIEHSPRVLFAACGAFSGMPRIASLNTSSPYTAGQYKCVNFTTTSALPSGARLTAEGFHGLKFRNATIDIVDLDLPRFRGAL